MFYIFAIYVTAKKQRRRTFFRATLKTKTTAYVLLKDETHA